MDNRPGVLSLFTFSIDPVFFFLSPPVSRQIYLIYLFLSFHLTSQKSGCRRCQLHLRPSKRLLCLPAEENHRPDRISLAQNRHNYLGAALLHLIRGDRDKCFFSPRRTDILTFGDCQLGEYFFNIISPSRSVNISSGVPSRRRSVRRISFGMTTRPRSSILLTIPVAFMILPPAYHVCHIVCLMGSMWKCRRIIHLKWFVPILELKIFAFFIPAVSSDSD